MIISHQYIYTPTIILIKLQEGNKRRERKWFNKLAYFINKHRFHHMANTKALPNAYMISASFILLLHALEYERSAIALPTSLFICFTYSFYGLGNDFSQFCYNGKISYWDSKC